MNLSKSRFYQSYGNKHERLQRSIQRYNASVTDTISRSGLKTMTKADVPH